MKTLAQIAAELQGYDPQALRADAVNEFLARLVEPVAECEDVGLFEALGRVLAADVISPLDVPPHDNSAMDGFAFMGSDLRSHGGSASGTAPVRLSLAIQGTAFAGKAWRGAAGAGQCVKVMTGAIMPPGMDTVVPQEFVVVEGGRASFAAQGLAAGDNRRLAGEDIRSGHIALQKGELLTPAALGLMASLGIPVAPVRRRLKVAYFSTGDEILSLGEPPREGAVYDSNRYTVFGLLTRLGVEVIDLGVVRDEPAALEAAFRSAAARADAIITSGGVSVGEADHTKAMMRKLAGEDDSNGVAFWRIAMRPGRPMAVGRINRPPVIETVKNGIGPHGTSTDSYINNSDSATKPILFGLPGNPVAVMVTFLAFVRPALLKMMGCRPQVQPFLRATSAGDIRKKPGRTEYQRGIVTAQPDGSLQVAITGNQGSGVLSSMVQANGLIVLHHDQDNVAAGDLVDVMMFDGAM